MFDLVKQCCSRTAVEFSACRRRRLKGSEKNGLSAAHVDVSATGVRTTRGLAMPGDVVSGVVKGVTTAASGVGLGAVTLVTAPVAGASDSGVVGGVVGIGQGVVGLGAGVVGGTLGGAAQIVGGTINTPYTLAAVLDSVDEDGDLYGKETIDLSTVALDKSAHGRRRMLDDVVHAATRPNEADREYTPRANVKDMTLYDALGVPPTAKQREIKKAFFTLAKSAHPDKGGDKDAFSKVGDAWQVLSDPSRRKRYDEGGLEALAEQPMADPAVLFAMMFGEDRFAHLVGELTAAMSMSLGDDERRSQQQLHEMQAEREQTLAKLLALRLDQWMSDKEAFAKEALEEYRSLAQVNLGPQMLGAIGTTYELTANAQLGVSGAGSRGLLASVHAASHSFETYSRAIDAAWFLQSKGPKSDHDVQTSLFSVMAMDIEATVGRAALLCLHDSSVERASRHQRALGLVKLGRIFQGQVPGRVQSESPRLAPTPDNSGGADAGPDGR